MNLQPANQGKKACSGHVDFLTKMGRACDWPESNYAFNSDSVAAVAAIRLCPAVHLQMWQVCCLTQSTIKIHLCFSQIIRDLSLFSSHRKNWFAVRCECLHLIKKNSHCSFTCCEFFLIRCKHSQRTANRILRWLEKRLKSGNLVFVKCEQSKNVNSIREFEYTENVKIFVKTLFLIKRCCEAIGKFSQMV